MDQNHNHDVQDSQHSNHKNNINNEHIHEEQEKQGKQHNHNHDSNEVHQEHDSHGVKDDQSLHEGHNDHHIMMVEDFKRRFFFSIIIMIPILILSPMIQMFLRVNWRFSGDSYLLFALSTILFFYGGKPFLFGARDELKKQSPAMKTLIALAISVSYVYSTLTIFVLEGNDFFWELATLIVIMLLGHWIEMKSVMGASKALEELVKLMPEEAHLIQENGAIIDVLAKQLKAGDKVLVKPGEKIPIDGFVYDGSSAVNESMITGESVPVDKKMVTK